MFVWPTGHQLCGLVSREPCPVATESSLVYPSSAFDGIEQSIPLVQRCIGCL